jgi:hypothetical protein
MSQSLDEKTWKILIERIAVGKCTPFLGAGANYGLLPLGADVARQWAAKYKYPFPDSSDLVKVAQYVALNDDPMTPKEKILEILRDQAKAPDFRDPLQPHRALADLPLPVYLTTNYDNLMLEALTYRLRDAKRELCRWNRQVKRQASIFDAQPDFRPTVANPIVFHLHGHDQVSESLVLTEDDYMDFLVNISSPNNTLIPSAIEEALSERTLLFIGYKIADWSFRVVLRGIFRSREPGLGRTNVAVMLPPSGEELVSSGAVESSGENAQEYLNNYYKNMGIQVYWGTVKEFVTELNERLVRRAGANPV